MTARISADTPAPRWLQRLTQVSGKPAGGLSIEEKVAEMQAMRRADRQRAEHRALLHSIYDGLRAKR